MFIYFAWKVLDLRDLLHCWSVLYVPDFTTMDWVRLVIRYISRLVRGHRRRSLLFWDKYYHTRVSVLPWCDMYSRVLLCFLDKIMLDCWMTGGNFIPIHVPRRTILELKYSIKCSDIVVYLTHRLYFSIKSDYSKKNCKALVFQFWLYVTQYRISSCVK